MIPLILVARGSMDARAAETTRSLVQAVAAARPGARVRAAFLDAEVPRLPAALVKEAGLGHRRAVVVPLLLTDGYHARVRLAAGLDTTASSTLALSVRVGRVIGPVDAAVTPHPVRDLMVSALVRRLGEVLPTRPDGIVLAASGSPVSRSVGTIELVARALGSAVGAPCRAGYVSLGRPTVEEAALAFRREGARRVAVATYLLGPGLRFARVVADAKAADVTAVAPPLLAAPELIEIVLHRAAQAADGGW
jgi:sirohydrochlorin ferrochelatase